LYGALTTSKQDPVQIFSCVLTTELKWANSCSLSTGNCSVADNSCRHFSHSNRNDTERNENWPRWQHRCWCIQLGGQLPRTNGPKELQVTLWPEASGGW